MLFGKMVCVEGEGGLYPLSEQFCGMWRQERQLAHRKWGLTLIKYIRGISTWEPAVMILQDTHDGLLLHGLELYSCLT